MKLEIKSVNKKYGRKKVLNDISFEAESGECVGILGANGSGKSTLLSILAGVIRPNGGEFLIDGENLFLSRKKISDYVGFVPQGTPLMDELTAFDNLSLWYSKSEIKESLKNGILKTLGIDEFIKVPVSKMSGGMKKRLSIGCAVYKNQSILLLDEPTAALDIICKQDIANYLEMRKSKGDILLLATHDFSELKLCDKHYIIKNGNIVPFDFENDAERLLECIR